MKATTVVGMMNDLQRKLNNFDMHALINKVQNHLIDNNQVVKLIDDIYNLEEDLIILDCEKK